jgi:hypothetical protein
MEEDDNFMSDVGESLGESLGDLFEDEGGDDIDFDDVAVGSDIKSVASGHDKTHHASDADKTEIPFQPVLPQFIDMQPQQLFREKDGTFNKNTKKLPVMPISQENVPEPPSDVMNVDKVFDTLSVLSTSTSTKPPPSVRRPSVTSSHRAQKETKKPPLRLGEAEKIERIALISELAILKSDSYSTTIDTETATPGELRQTVISLKKQKARDIGISGYAQKTMMFMNGLQFEEEHWNMLKLNLKGLALQINDKLPEFRQIFGELYDEHGEMFKIPPLAKFGAMLLFSVYSCHKANSGQPVGESISGLMNVMLPTTSQPVPAPPPMTKPIIGAPKRNLSETKV